MSKNGAKAIVPKHLQRYVCPDCKGSSRFSLFSADFGKLQGPCVKCGGKNFLFDDLWEAIDGLAISANMLCNLVVEILLPAIASKPLKRDVGALCMQVNNWLSVAGVARQVLQPDRGKVEVVDGVITAKKKDLIIAP